MTRACAVAAALVVQLALIGCDQENAPLRMMLAASAHEPMSAGIGPECPHDWKDRRNFPPGGTPTAGAHQNVPEYNDCQRFLSVESRFTRYDSLQAVFARYRLDAVYNNPLIGRRPARPDGTFAELIQSERFIAAFPNASRAPDAPWRVVTIGVVYSEGRYLPLGIADKINCLVLVWREGRTELGYAAVMVPVGDTDVCLGETSLDFSSNIQTSQAGRRGGRGAAPRSNPRVLFVTAKPPARGHTIPMAARWDFDQRNGRYYIGAKCPTGYCEIHSQRDHFSSPAYLPESSDPSLGNGHTVMVKGLYDEQYLSDVRGWGLGRDGVFGTVFPHPQLEGRTIDHYRAAKWLPAATVVLTGDARAYLRYKGYAEASVTGPYRPGVPAKQVTVSLCFVPIQTGVDHARAAKNKCGIPFKLQQSPHHQCVADTKNSGKWYALVKVGTTQGRLFCVTYRPLPPGAIPPLAVRWRWSVLDETIWIPCPFACCEKVVPDCDPETDPECEITEGDSEEASAVVAKPAPAPTASPRMAYHFPYPMGRW